MPRQFPITLSAQRTDNRLNIGRRYSPVFPRCWLTMQNSIPERGYAKGSSAYTSKSWLDHFQSLCHQIAVISRLSQILSNQRMGKYVNQAMRNNGGLDRLDMMKHMRKCFGKGSPDMLRLTSTHAWLKVLAGKGTPEKFDVAFGSVNIPALFWIAA